jgi:uncharacterized protein YpiB (UPF0302 family)
MEINNKNIVVEPLFKNCKKAIHFNSSTENSEVMLVLESNDAGVKKLSQVLYKQSNDSSAYINAATPFLCTQL